MKKLVLLMSVLLGCWACEDDDPLVLELDPTIAFIENEATINLSYDFDKDTVYSTEIQLIGTVSTTDIPVSISLSESSSATAREYISFENEITLLDGEYSTEVSFLIRGGALDEEEAIFAEFELKADGYKSGANVSKLSISLQKLSKPECDKDFSGYTSSLAMTTEDSWGYSWDWGGSKEMTLVLDEVIPNRLANYNFYGWSDSQPVFFELSCMDNSVTVIPIVGYSTPGDYVFDITGGTGTYDDELKTISVTYNCVNAGDGEFTITETYTKVCGVDATEYVGPLNVTTGDSWGYSWDWNAATDMMLVADSSIVNRLSNSNFYGWSDSQPVYFDLSCDDNTVLVVPITDYTTPGGYVFDITGGSGTYNASTKKITVTYECSHVSDGEFTITETYG